MLEYYNGEEAGRDPAAAGFVEDSPEARIKLVEKGSEQPAIETGGADPGHDQALEKIMADVLGFIRKIDLDAL